MSIPKANWFVALPIPAGTWFTQAIKSYPDGVRIFAPEDLHLTIAFLGAMKAEKEEAIIEAIRRVKAEPFALTLGKLIPLPSARFVSAFSFEVHHGYKESSEFIALYRTIFLQIAGALPDDRPPLPHITIARPLRKSDRKTRHIALEWATLVQLPSEELAINKIALYSWSDDRSTRQFKIVYEQPLSL